MSVERITERKVPGRKSVVKMAMIFIDELSRLLAAASSLESAASCFESEAMLIFRRLSSWATRLKSYHS